MPLWTESQPVVGLAFCFLGLPSVDPLRRRKGTERIGIVEVTMTGARRKKYSRDFVSILARCGAEDAGKLIALEQFVEESTENPEAFMEEWLRPLLRQGLSMEQAYEVVIEGALRPN